MTFITFFKSFSYYPFWQKQTPNKSLRTNVNVFFFDIFFPYGLNYTYSCFSKIETKQSFTETRLKTHFLYSELK